MLSNKTDKELLQLYHEGKEAAFTEIVNRYKGIVKLIAREFFLIGGDKEDIVQEGMIGLFDAVMHYDASKNASFATFANVCIRRKMIKAVEFDNRQKNKALNSSLSINIEQETSDIRGSEFGKLLENYQDSFSDPEDIYLDKESEAIFKEDLYKILSPMEKVIADEFLAGHSYKDIAKKLDKSPKSIDNAIQRILAKAKKVLGLTN